VTARSEERVVASRHSDLELMVASFRDAKPIYWPSPFWEKLIGEQAANFDDESIRQFKRTFNRQYFSWDLRWIVTVLLWPVLRNWLRHPDVTLFRGSVANLNDLSGSSGPNRLLRRLENRVYGTYIVLLAHLVRRHDRDGLLAKLQEPEFGCPIVVDVKGRRLSQDLANSVHEYDASTRGFGVRTEPQLDVIELGAGYGRFGYVLLSARPNSTYTVVDIPPALFVAQTYLTEVFPDEPVFRFRPFSAYEEIEDEFRAARIRFVAAHQIELLPDHSADLFVNISSLHEMTRDQIGHYLVQIDRLTRSFFYSKQWRKSRAPGNEFRIAQGEYPLPPTWKTVYEERHPVQPLFFHGLYELPAGRPVS
jgi:putative sugar O-methyltransferase